MTLHLKIKPGARQNQVMVLPDGTIQVKVKAPAQDGKANEELIRFLAWKLDIPKSRIQIVTGHTSPFKKLDINAEEAWVRQMILA